MVERFVRVRVVGLLLGILPCLGSANDSLFDSSIAFLFKKVTIP